MNMNIYKIYFRRSFYSDDDEEIYYSDIYLDNAKEFVNVYVYEKDNKYYDINTSEEIPSKIIKNKEIVDLKEIKEEILFIRHSILEYSSKLRCEIEELTNKKNIKRR